jgi:vancomycin permeability regulator SanA
VSNDLPPPRRGIARRRWWIVAAVLAVVALIPAGTFAAIRITTAGRTYSVADVPAVPVALVLGAGLSAGGGPSPYLAERLDTTVALWRAGKVKAVLVSGDNSTPSHDEPTAMRDYLVAHGVPADKVVRDPAGIDTYASCVRAEKVFGVHRAVVVTQAFHLPRALFLCAGAGVQVVGVAAADPAGARISDTAREVAASVKAVWQNTFGPDPSLLGPFEPGLQQAVAG